MISAHYDHVGRGNRTNSYGPFGQIHNGADDNASGTAALLELAEALATLEQPPRRTILLALWDAEEKGLLGSTHWVSHPTPAGLRPLFLINVDMIGRLREDRLTVYGVRTATGLRYATSTANMQTDMELLFDWQQRRDSDHLPFFERDVPYLMFHTGLHDDYHRPSDDPDRINVEGLQSVARLMLTVALDVAERPETPEFRPESRRENERLRRESEQIVRPQPRLGIRWNWQRTAGDPVIVTAVDPGSPADRGGLEVGDRIIAIDGMDPSTSGDLRPIVHAASNIATFVVERGRARPAAGSWRCICAASHSRSVWTGARTTQSRTRSSFVMLFQVRRPHASGSSRTTASTSDWGCFRCVRKQPASRTPTTGPTVPGSRW